MKIRYTFFLAFIIYFAGVVILNISTDGNIDGKKNFKDIVSVIAITWPFFLIIWYGIGYIFEIIFSWFNIEKISLFIPYLIIFTVYWFIFKNEIIFLSYSKLLIFIFIICGFKILISKNLYKN